MNVILTMLVGWTLAQVQPEVAERTAAEPAAAEPAAAEPAAAEPAVVEPTVAEPTVVEPSSQVPGSPWLAPATTPAIQLAPDGERWRVSAGVGQARTWSDGPRWAAGLGNPIGHLRVERGLEQLSPGLAACVGVNGWNKGEVEGSTNLSLWVVDLALGATYVWPAAGLGEVLFPYARAAVLLSYVQARTGDELGADLWAIPGLEGAAGLRLHLGRAGPRDWGRLFVFGEANLAVRWPRRVRLERPEQDDDPLLPAVPTRLGRLDLSGWGWQVGAGLVF